MAPGCTERLTNRQSDRSTSTSGSPERVAQVRTHRTAPLDQPVADPSSLPASHLRDRMNQRTPCASTGEFFNTIRQQWTWANLWRWLTLRATLNALSRQSRRARDDQPLCQYQCGPEAQLIAKRETHSIVTSRDVCRECVPK